MNFKLPRVSIITGHYGCGKTNIAVNLAMQLHARGEKVVIADLDIVNPYFRTSDFTGMLQKKGIEVISPQFANTNLDVPSLPPQVLSIFNRDDAYIILDVGGDDAGAVALGGLSARIRELDDWRMFYVVNAYRVWTSDAQSGLELMREIEKASRLQCGALIHNSNLSYETTPQTVSDALPFIEELARLADLPVFFTAAKQELIASLPKEIEPVLPVEIYVKPPWKD